MKTLRAASLILLIGVVALAPACSRGKSKNVRLQQQLNARTKEIGDLLAGVTDVPSAEAAEPKIVAAIDEFHRIEYSLDVAYDAEASQSEAMTEAVAQGIAQTQRMNAETLRISKAPELVAALGTTWRRLPSVFLLEAAGAIPKAK